MPQEILQIVPGLRPDINGVGDYACVLAKQLRKGHDIQTRFVVCDPSWEGDSELDGFSVEKLCVRQAAELTKHLSKRSATRIVLLQYVGYGYEKRGCPRWLVDGLERWLSQSPNRSLITMFHEVYASGPLWTSSFYLSPVQKRLASRVAGLSRRILTNRAQYAEILRALVKNGNKEIPVLPVFSNVGEPDHTPLPLRERRRTLAVFGGGANRERVFRESVEVLESVCRALRIEEILDVGAIVEHNVLQVDGVPVTRTGYQPAHAVSALLSESIAGFFNYPTDCLSKSGMFAAYCAHRMLPVGVYHKMRQHTDGLRGGEHFWLANSHIGVWDYVAGQTIADNAHRWYQKHNLLEQAKVFASFIGKSERSADVAQGTLPCDVEGTVRRAT